MFFIKKNRKFLISLYKIIIILFCSVAVIYIKNKIKNDKEIKICICTLGKKENKYLRQFVEHYKNLEVDKIFLYDNNELNGEKFQEVIQDYVDSGFVEIIDWRGLKRQQLFIMNNCYLKNNRNYDWLIFYDIDEFIYLKDFSSLKTYLNDHRFRYCKKVQLNWNMHTDNQLLYYDNRPLSVRFPERENKNRGKIKGAISTIKSMIRGGINNLTIDCIHRLSYNLKACNGFGKEMKFLSIYTDKCDYEYYFIDHYYCKSTEEFIDKINKDDAIRGQNIDNKLSRIKAYFEINKVTLEKVELIENRTGFNLSKYKRNLLKLFNLLI